jgi:hypothetical protein
VAANEAVAVVGDELGEQKGEVGFLFQIVIQGKGLIAEGFAAVFTSVALYGTEGFGVVEAIFCVPLTVIV